MLCSLAMPADYEVSAYSSALSRMGRLHASVSAPRGPSPVVVRRPTSLPLNGAGDSPRRPCLVVRDFQDDSPSEQVQDGDQGKSKKKVVFADDKGLSLTQVKVMTEPSSAPPRWNMQFLAQVTRGLSAEVAPEPWEATFPQPASDYLTFRGQLEQNSVSLENVIVREAEQVVVGTVKVRNLAFHKEVLVRCSSDSWQTHEDSYCSYVNNGLKASSVTVLYDTFSFRLALPPRSRRLEFCVCFRCGESEYWDNNGGCNYAIVKKSSPCSQKSIDELTAKISQAGFIHSHPSIEEPSRGKHADDALYAKLDSWSEFASWNHLSVNGPYY